MGECSILCFIVLLYTGSYAYVRILKSAALSLELL